MRVMTVETLTENDVFQAFSGMAGDLAACCREAGEPARVHVDDLADAIYNSFQWKRGENGRNASADDVTAAFKKIKTFIRKRLTDRARGSWVSL